MEENFVPYKESQALRGLGFNEPCFRVLHDETEIIRPLYDEGETYVKNSMWDDSRFVANPTYQQAFRWFRKEYNLDGSVIPIDAGVVVVDSWAICRRDDSDKYWEGPQYESYEEAELACLRKLIEIIKKKELYYLNLE